MVEKILNAAHKKLQEITLKRGLQNRIMCLVLLYITYEQHYFFQAPIWATQLLTPNGIIIGNYTRNIGTLYGRKLGAILGNKPEKKK